MKNSGSANTSVKASGQNNNGQGIAYGQPYLSNGNGVDQSNRAATNTNLKSYINELKKASNANKSGGKRGHSSTRNGAAPANT